MLAGVGIALAAATGKIKSGIVGDKNLPYGIAGTVIAYGVFRFLYGKRNNRALKRGGMSMYVDGHCIKSRSKSQ